VAAMAGRSRYIIPGVYRFPADPEQFSLKA
jgi:hypothetical protein